jgi:hypothetical protein
VVVMLVESGERETQTQRGPHAIGSLLPAFALHHCDTHPCAFA